MDDATRRVDVAVLADEQTPTVDSVLSLEADWFNGQSIACRRMRDGNSPADVSRALAKACRTLGLRHIHPRRSLPRTNAKAERAGLRPTPSTSGPSA